MLCTVNLLQWSFLGVGLSRLVTPSLSEDIQCHVGPYSCYTYKPPDQTSDYIQSGLSAWWLQMVIYNYQTVCVDRYAHYHPLRMLPLEQFNGEKQKERKTQADLG